MTTHLRNADRNSLCFVVFNLSDCEEMYHEPSRKNNPGRVSSVCGKLLKAE